MKSAIARIIWAGRDYVKRRPYRIVRQIMKRTTISLFLGFWLILGGAVVAQEPARVQSNRWTQEHANQWYAKQLWLVGSNYIPSDAINELEMWQADTFDPKRIDTELG